ncbi:hypothetical protein HOD08_04785 [bacterium]|nr:hypothetical protein [bacterium]
MKSFKIAALCMVTFTANHLHCGITFSEMKYHNRMDREASKEQMVEISRTLYNIDPQIAEKIKNFRGFPKLKNFVRHIADLLAEQIYINRRTDIAEKLVAEFVNGGPLLPVAIEIIADRVRLLTTKETAHGMIDILNFGYLSERIIPTISEEVEPIKPIVSIILCNIVYAAYNMMMGELPSYTPDCVSQKVTHQLSRMPSIAPIRWLKYAVDTLKCEKSPFTHRADSLIRNMSDVHNNIIAILRGFIIPRLLEDGMFDKFRNENSQFSYE